MAAEAAVSYVVQKLGDTLARKVEFLGGIEEQVQQLKVKLEFMQSFLKDTSEKQANNESIRTWISNLREVAHDAEDAIDTYFVRIDKTRRSRGPLGKCACFPVHLYHLNMLGMEIKSIKSKLDVISGEKDRYGIETSGSRIESSSKRRLDIIGWHRRLDHWKKDKDVVGLREDVESLIKKAILTKMEGLSSATVEGMGGIGKTTLAMMVYNDAAIVNAFDRGWVVVSDEFNPKQVIKELILQFLKPTDNKLEVLEIMEKLELPHLQQMLHESLKGIRYFIVLDDVWENTHWEALASAFPDEDKGGRLLVTSRNRIKTKYTHYIHEMKFLNPEESWKLLLKKAFTNNSNDKCPPDLEDIGREISEKCKGLPLAIDVAGGLLLNEGESWSGWERVLKKMRSHLDRSAGSTVSAILELSYQNLPPELKSCFLRLAFFKEDAAICAQMLIHIWVAQGVVVVQEGDQRAREEIARGYLDELIIQNLVQVKEMGGDDRVKTCYVHDLLRDLSIRKAKEEISLEILKIDPNNTSRSNLLNKPRHLIVDCRFLRNDDDLSLLLLHHQINSKRVRSLFFRASNNISSISWKSFSLLRVLHCESDGAIILSETIGTLSELRYLGLRARGECFLPKSLGRLENLEVLDLRMALAYSGSNNFLGKMDGLCHIYIDGPIREGNWKNIESLKNLETLITIACSSWRSMVRNPAGMTSLRKLGIYFDKVTEQDELMAIELFSSLAMLPNLECLKLYYTFLHWHVKLDGMDKLHRLTRLTIIGVGDIQQLPSSSSNFPPNLSHLSLICIDFEEDPMVVLEKLPNLLYLKLDTVQYTEGENDEMVISHDGFPRLKVFSLHNITWLRNIRVMNDNGGGIWELKRLEIHECPELDTSNLPERLRAVVINI